MRGGNMKKGNHYVDNKKFYEEMVIFKKMVNEARDKGEEDPPSTEYMGKCFLDIANGLSFRPNFINYTYKEEMISDGIENCLQYMDNFDPEKSSNPFAYFTQIIYFAFIRRITKEKKQSKIKEKLLKSSNIEDMITTQIHDDEREYQQQFLDYLNKYNFSDD